VRRPRVQAVPDTMRLRIVRLDAWVALQPRARASPGIVEDPTHSLHSAGKLTRLSDRMGAP